MSSLIHTYPGHPCWLRTAHQVMVWTHAIKTSTINVAHVSVVRFSYICSAVTRTKRFTLTFSQSNIFTNAVDETVQHVLSPLENYPPTVELRQTQEKKYIYIYHVYIYTTKPITRPDSHHVIGKYRIFDGKLYCTVFGKPSKIGYIGQFWNDAVEQMKAPIVRKSGKDNEWH